MFFELVFAQPQALLFLFGRLQSQEKLLAAQHRLGQLGLLRRQLPAEVFTLSFTLAVFFAKAPQLIPGLLDVSDRTARSIEFPADNVKFFLESPGPALGYLLRLCLLLLEA